MGAFYPDRENYFVIEILKYHLSHTENKCIQTFSRLYYSLETLQSLYLEQCQPNLLVTQLPLETPLHPKDLYTALVMCPKKQNFFSG